MNESTTVAAFCGECGARNAEDRKFCPSCGTSLQLGAEQVVAPTSAPATVTAPAPTPAPSPTPSPSTKTTHETLLPDWWQRLAAFAIDSALIFCVTALAMGLTLRVVGLVADFDDQERFGRMLSDWATASVFSIGGLFGIALAAGTYWYYDTMLGSEHRATAGQRLLGFRLNDMTTDAHIGHGARQRYSALMVLLYSLPVVSYVAAPVAVVMFFARDDRRLPQDLSADVIARSR